MCMETIKKWTLREALEFETVQNVLLDILNDNFADSVRILYEFQVRIV